MPCVCSLPPMVVDRVIPLEDVKEFSKTILAHVQEDCAEQNKRCDECRKASCQAMDQGRYAILLGELHLSNELMDLNKLSSINPYVTILPDITAGLNILPNKITLSNVAVIDSKELAEDLLHKEFVTGEDITKRMGECKKEMAVILSATGPITPMTREYLDYVRIYWDTLGRMSRDLSLSQLPDIDFPCRNIYLRIGGPVFDLLLEQPVVLPEIWKLNRIYNHTYYFDKIACYTGEYRIKKNDVLPILTDQMLKELIEFGGVAFMEV